MDVAALRGYLARMGFPQSPTVTEPGEFAVRGGLIDVWPPGRPAPVRLDFFGDALDERAAVRPGDAADDREAEAAWSSRRCREVILDEAAITAVPQRYRVEFGAAGDDDPLYEAVSAGRKHAGLGALAAVLPRAAGDAVRLSAEARR